MALVFDKSNVIGHLTVRVDGIADPITVDIYGGNALAVFVYTHDGSDELFWFFANSEHLKNMYKQDRNVFPFEVLKCVILYEHRSAPTLVKYLTRSGVSVTCI